MPSPLISTDDLAARLGEPGLKIVDASWHLDGRDAWPDFEAARIPGAVYFDLEASSDPRDDLPHMLPDPKRFAARMGRLGLSEGDDIVVYDTVGIRSAPRVWWMLRTLGARDVRVLDGGLPRWRAHGRPIETAAPEPIRAVTFRAALNRDALADLDEVRDVLADGGQVLDARSAPRFRGEAAEPRPGLRSGHMPGALNLPFPELLDEDGMMKRGAELETAFRQAGIDPDRPVITTCGSGVTAAILSLGLAELGRSSRLYDGSWAEWGGREDTAVATGS